MSKKYETATIIEKANIYFDGKVNSRTLVTQDGRTVTLGFMLSGDYRFSTNQAELMTVINGEMSIKQANEIDWISYTEGMSFNVPENSHFDVQIPTFADYSCSYL